MSYILNLVLGYLVVGAMISIIQRDNGDEDAGQSVLTRLATTFFWIIDLFKKLKTTIFQRKGNVFDTD